jgi:hypothetical protein
MWLVAINCGTLMKCVIFNVFAAESEFLDATLEDLLTPPLVNGPMICLKKLPIET